jgi:hypothetical protein
MIRSERLWAVIVALVSALLLAGCSEDSSPNAPTGHSRRVVINDEFTASQLDATRFDTETTGLGTVSVAGGILDIVSGYGGSGSALVRSRRAFTLADTLVIFEGRISTYCEGVYPGIYGDSQPRGLRVGNDANNAVEFISYDNSTVEARTVASGVDTLTDYTLPGGAMVNTWVTYRIEATSDSARYFVDGVLVTTHKTHIPTGRLNLYVGTSYNGFGNVPVGADRLYLAYQPR